MRLIIASIFFIIAITCLIWDFMREKEGRGILALTILFVMLAWTNYMLGLEILWVINCL